MSKKKWDRDSCIQAIEDFIQKNGAIPKTYELGGALPTPTAFTKYVGKSIGAYCKDHYPELKTGRDRGRVPIWNRESCIQAVENYIREHQAIPLSSKAHPPLPNAGTFKKCVGQPMGVYCSEHHPELPSNVHRFTKEAIRAATDAFYARHGRQARTVEHRAYNGLPSHNTITACFNMTTREYWDTFYPNPENQWSLELVLDALKKYQADNGRLPNQTIFFTSGSQFPTKAVFQKISGGMKYADFLQLHFPGLDKTGWSQEGIIEAVKEFERKYGALPRSTDFHEKNGLPCITTFYRTFPCQRLEDVYARWLPDRQIRPIQLAKAKLDEQTVVQSLRKFVETNQRLPMSHEYNSLYGLPSYATLKKFLNRPIGEVYQELFPEYYPEQKGNEPHSTPELEEVQDFGGMAISM